MSRVFFIFFHPFEFPSLSLTKMLSLFFHPSHQARCTASRRTRPSWPRGDTAGPTSPRLAPTPARGTAARWRPAPACPTRRCGEPGQNGSCWRGRRPNRWQNSFLAWPAHNLKPPPRQDGAGSGCRRKNAQMIALASSERADGPRKNESGVRPGQVWPPPSTR